MIPDEAIDRFVEREVGSGSIYGSGYGYGDGSGHGYGNGYGYGSGHGSGHGYGYGDGSGSGDGDGNIVSYCGERVVMIDDIPTILRRIHGNAAVGAILRSDDLTLEKCYVVKGGGCFAHGATLHEARAALEQKLLAAMSTEERIRRFLAAHRRGVKYPVRQFYDWHHALTGSCEMGRKEFARAHGIDIDGGMMTPEEFVELTKDAWGGAVIRALKDAMDLQEEE